MAFIVALRARQNRAVSYWQRGAAAMLAAMLLAMPRLLRYENIGIITQHDQRQRAHRHHTLIYTLLMLSAC